MCFLTFLISSTQKIMKIHICLSKIGQAVAEIQAFKVGENQCAIKRDNEWLFDLIQEFEINMRLQIQNLKCNYWLWSFRMSSNDWWRKNWKNSQFGHLVAIFIRKGCCVHSCVLQLQRIITQKPLCLFWQMIHQNFRLDL